MKDKAKFQAINSTGEVVGAGKAQPCPVILHGWTFSNSSATGYEVDFYVPVAAATGSGQYPAVPSASGTKVFTIQVPGTSSKEVAPTDNGVTFPDGLFAIASNVAVTGGVFYS